MKDKLANNEYSEMYSGNGVGRQGQIEVKKGRGMGVGHNR